MSIIKGHDRPKPVIDNPIQLDAVAPVVVEEERLQELQKFLKETASPKTYGILIKLAKLQPAARLTINLKSTLGILTTAPITHVLQNGLSVDERSALVEVDMTANSVRIRETAHALLNIHERIKMVEVFQKTYKELRARKPYLTEHLLD